MAVISTPRWLGEPIKLVIRFNDSTSYTVYSDKSYDLNTANFIKDIKFHLSEGNNSVNPLGIAASNRIDIQVFDENNYLNPSNPNSPYYGMMVSGIEINAYISYDGTNWEDYGTFFVTSWSGSFSEGYFGLANISAEDILNSLGNIDMPYIPVFSETRTVEQIVTYVFDKIGLTANDFSVDNSVNKNISYMIIKGSKVRDFLNNICQFVLARVIVTRQGKIRFVSPVTLYTGYNSLTIGAEYTGSITNKIATNIDYSKAKITYLGKNGVTKGTIESMSGVELAVGVNSFSMLFEKTVLAIEQVQVLYDQRETVGTITDISYQGYQNGITVNITVDTAAIEDATVVITGTILNIAEKSIELNLRPNNIGGTNTLVGGRIYEYNTKQMLTPLEAMTIALGLRTYLNIISKRYTISGSGLTPKLNTGDLLVVSGTNTIYDGNYKVIDLSIEFGENYSLTCNLIKIELT